MNHITTMTTTMRTTTGIASSSLLLLFCVGIYSHSVVGFTLPLRINGCNSLETKRSTRSLNHPQHPLFTSLDDDNSSHGDELLKRDSITQLSPASFLDKYKESLFLGIEPTPTVVAIMIIYFVEGALGLASLARTYLLKDELHLGPAEMSALTGIFALPWTIKPLYGFISDGIPLWGYKRRSYLVICGLLGSLSCAAVALNVGGNALTTTIGSLLLASACIAFSDVVADGMVVEQTKKSADPNVAGGLQSLCWGSAAAGALLSAYFSGSLLEIMTPRHVFGLTAVLPFIVTLIALTIDEEKVEGGANPPLSQVQDLWSAIKEPAIYKPALFLFLWQSTPTSDGAFLYFMTNDLGMGPEFLGRVRLVSSLAGLVGVWVYQRYLRAVPIQTILLWSSLLSTPLGLTSLLLITHANRALGIPDGAFVLGDDVVLAILGQVAFLPTLVLAAKLCPPGVEAVLFATLMSVFNTASTLGTEVGALLTKALGVTEDNFDNLGLLTIICNVSSLYPLLFIGWLDGVGSQSEAEMEEAAAALLLEQTYEASASPLVAFETIPKPTTVTAGDYSDKQ